ncbi:MAG: RAMP superfamily CRISPR-associated protein, partial [bacterium]
AIIKIRDGVAIDSKTGIAIDEKKYDYEVVEPGALFDLHMEVTVREAFDKGIFKLILSTIVNLLDGKISFGAKTTSGFGRCKLENMKYYEFDFSKQDDVWRWLNQEFLQGITLDGDPLPIKQNAFIVDAVFSIKNSLIVKSYAHDPDSSDAVHVKSANKNVLPGTSIKGAIRARGLKILKTLEWTDAEDMIDKLFGMVDEKKKEKIKSRVTVEETEIKNVAAELQHRIKIDRFTGGVIKTALFDSMPLWGDGNDKAV